MLSRSGLGQRDMQKGRRYWNGSVGGLCGAAIQAGIAYLNCFLDKSSTWATLPNLGSVGSAVVIQRAVVIRYPGQIELGDRVRIGRRVKLASEYPNGRLVIGARTWIGRGCHLDFSGDLTIGEDSTLSENTRVVTHDHDLSPRSVPEKKPLTIGSRVWVGADVMILPRVGQIGDDSIIAAGTVLTRTVPGGVIVAGSPGRVIRRIDQLSL